MTAFLSRIVEGASESLVGRGPSADQRSATLRLRQASTDFGFPTIAHSRWLTYQASAAKPSASEVSSAASRCWAAAQFADGQGAPPQSLLCGPPQGVSWT